ncbi:MAG: response regulator, partial [Actinobacteria bacterium]|nr:response regulator [Actinomycetota bacterium]
MTERAKVLLVDDRPENLLALEALLEPLGQELVRAQSGEEALRHLLQQEFAAILLDVQMPGLDGFQTAELIKQRERTRHVPILFLTAISKDTEHVVRGYGAGAVDYLMKPFDPHILRAKVAVFIDLWQKTAEIRRQDALLGEQELAALERASEERYQSLADAVPQIVFTADSNARVTYYNKRWFDYTGLPRDAASDWHSVIHPEDIDEVLELWQSAVAEGERWECEYRLRRTSDEAFRWHLGRSLPIRDDAGVVVSWVGTATDIHDRRIGEERQRFLAQAGWVLGSSLDYQQT